MADHVLVPLDESEQSMGALRYALDEHPEARLTALTVIDPIDAAYTIDVLFQASEWYEDEREAAEARFEEARGLAEERGLDLETEVEVGRPSRAIVEWAEANDVDVIAIGSHGRSGVRRVLLGSVAEAVVRRSPVPVVVVR